MFFVEKLIELVKEKIRFQYIKPEQAQALEELEKLIDNSIPQVEEIEWNTFGVKTDGKNVIGLGLYDQGLSTLPESIGNLRSLKELYLHRNQLSTLPESIGNLNSSNFSNLSLPQFGHTLIGILSLFL